MPTIDLTLPRPHIGQKRIIDNAARFNVVPCGRRFGKTVLGINRLATPETLGHPQAWYVPRYKDMLEVWRDCLTIFGPILKRKNATERRLEFITGGVVEFWSMENKDASRGRKYKRIIVDEAGLVPDLMEIWNYAIRPTLADMQGDGFFLGTPKGRNGFWQMWQWAQDSLLDEWGGFTMPTSANPFIPDSEIEALRSTLPERVYRQEILAEFLEDAGGVFRNVMQCATLEEIERPADGSQYCFGVDWGKLNDFTVITIFDVTKRQLVKIDRFNQIDYNFQLARLKSLYDLFRPVMIYAERNSMGEALIDRLRAENMPVYPMQTTNATKDSWIQSLSIAFERGEIEMVNDPVAIGELQAFEAKRLASGLMRYAAPEGLNDDIVMSMAMGWQGVDSDLNKVQFDTLELFT